MATADLTSWPACSPRWSTPRRPSRPTYGYQVMEIAKLLGTPLMPWQEYVVCVALETLPDGTFAYREVIVTVPRQQGKTTLLLSLEVWRATAYSRIVKKRQRIYYSAQTGKDGRQKLLDDQVPVIQDSKLASLLDNRRANGGIRRESGGEGIDFKGGRIDVMASGIDSGHGKVVDLALIDEAFADQDDRREQAMIPAMMTKRDAQLWVTSTAGWEGSAYLKRKVDAGRSAVADGVDTGLCFFEWSADPDLPADSPATWYSCMPALGHTINEAVVANALRTMEPEEFERAFLNRWTTGESRVIPKEVWDAVCSADLKPDGGICFGIDATPDRSRGSIVAMDSMRRGELVDNQDGVTWMVARVEELAKKFSAKVAIDSKGPAASLIPDLKAHGVSIVEYDAGMVADATARTYDAIADGFVKVRSVHGDPLDTAVAGARKRVSGERWYWGRSNATVDVSPLVALTLAFDLALKTKRKRDPIVFFGR